MQHKETVMTPSGSSLSPNFNHSGLTANSSEAGSAGSQQRNAGDKNEILQELDKISADLLKMQKELYGIKLKDRISKASPEEKAVIMKRLHEIKDKRTAEKIASATAGAEGKK